MSQDLHLPYADYYALAHSGVRATVPTYVNYDAGLMPCRHQWMPPSGQWGGQMNSLVYGLRIRTDDMKVAIPYILGYAESNGTTFRRVLPITDPDGFGMTATGISIRGYQSPTGLMKLEIPGNLGVDDVDNPAPDGNIYNDTISEFFDVSLGVPDGTQKIADLYTYVILSVTFEHAQYFRASNDNLDNDIGERDRFTIWNYVAGIEYVGLDSNVIQWMENNLGPFPQGPSPGAGTPPQNTFVGKGAGFVRATGELKCQWFGVPADALEVLLQKWLGIGNYPATIPDLIAPGYPVCGRTNHAEFTIDLTNVSGFVTFPPQTLLFQPPRLNIVPNPMGFRNYNIDISLTHRPETWNKFLHWPSGRYFRAGYTNQLPIDNPGVLDYTKFRPIYGLADFDAAFEAA